MPLPDLTIQARRYAPKELVEHLKAFSLDLKFSAGIWYMSPMNTRFHGKYKKDLDIEHRLEIAAGLAKYGLQGIEAHYPNEIDDNNLELWKKFAKDTGIKIVSVVPLLFHDPDFEFGSLSSPIVKARQNAIKRTIETMEINKELHTDFMIVWTGIDGFENPFGTDFAAMRDRFAYGLAEAMDTVPGVRMAFEPKPYEPRGRHLYGTTPEGLLLGLKVEAMLENETNRSILNDGHALVCLNPEIGHMLMAYEDLAYAYSMVLEYGRLAHTHVNSQPLGNYDQDLNVGVIAPEQLEAALYVMKMHSYNSWFGVDINPERMPVEIALRNSMDAIRAANDRINNLDHEKVIYATEHPEQARGWLESYLIRMRAMHPTQLSPLPTLSME